MDCIKLMPRIDIKVAYDYSRAESTYTYGLAAEHRARRRRVPLTPVMNELQRGTIDGRYFLTRRLALGLVYWYDKYRRRRLRAGPVASLAQPATGDRDADAARLLLPPYTANTRDGTDHVLVVGR